MDIIKWRASYETSIPSMDEQHKKLIDLINSMYRVMRDKEGQETIDMVLAEMAEYSNSHLKEEERLLQEHGYADYDAHLLFHEEYLKTMQNLTEERQKQEDADPGAIYNFLRQWWLNHIVVEDQKYGPFLKGKGVE